MKWTSTPSISVTNCGSAFSRASNRAKSYSVAQYRTSSWIVASCTPCERSATSSLVGQRVAARRRRRSSRSSLGISTRNGRTSMLAWTVLVMNQPLVRWDGLWLASSLDKGRRYYSCPVGGGRQAADDQRELAAPGAVGRGRPGPTEWLGLLARTRTAHRSHRRSRVRAPSAACSVTFPSVVTSVTYSAGQLVHRSGGTGPEVDMHVQIVTYRVADVSDHDFIEANREFAAMMADVPGLLAKVWLKDAAPGAFGGVYLWQDREACEFSGGRLMGRSPEGRFGGRPCLPRLRGDGRVDQAHPTGDAAGLGLESLQRLGVRHERTRGFKPLQPLHCP